MQMRGQKYVRKEITYPPTDIVWIRSTLFEYFSLKEFLLYPPNFVDLFERK